MPLFCINESLENCKFGIWKRDESISFFLENINLDSKELEQLYGMLPTRVIEWLSSRHLVKLILDTDKYHVFLKDQYGKPYVSGSDKYISLSHSGKWVAAAVCERPVGIDIEKLSNKAVKVREKFISPHDLLISGEEDEMMYCCRLWTIKEAVYKAYGKKGLLFKDQIRLLSDNECSVVLDKNKILNYTVHTRIFSDYIVSTAVLIN